MISSSLLTTSRYIDLLLPEVFSNQGVRLALNAAIDHERRESRRREDRPEPMQLLLLHRLTT
jgi:hypothetical protein